MFRRGGRGLLAALAVVAALAVPAAPAHAACLEAPGELARAWDGMWQWLAALVWGDGASTSSPQAASSDHGSYIDPNG
jgi:hypothetical protein